MNDLELYHDLKNRIAELESDLLNLNKKLKQCQYEKSKYKRKLEKLTGEKEKTRGEKALEMIKELKGTGKPMELIRMISKKIHISEYHCADLWYKSERL